MDRSLHTMSAYPLLETIDSPADVRKLDSRRLSQLATELRAFLVESVSRTGGHLSSNLGTVELTVALHHVYNTPEDRIVWDVGHQTYAHKILTGRREGMDAPARVRVLDIFHDRALACATALKPQLAASGLPVQATLRDAADRLCDALMQIARSYLDALQARAAHKPSRAAGHAMSVRPLPPITIGYTFSVGSTWKSMNTRSFLRLKASRSASSTSPGFSTRMPTWP